MDPLSQGAIGAALSGAVSRDEESRWAISVGFIGGVLADADVLIRSDTDPLLNIEYHRHFSHSLMFIPIGGLIGAALLWPLLKRWLRFPALARYSTLGYATAGLLDACTSYGTRLLWPFSDVRVAWNIISIIDPVFTLAVLSGLSFALFRKRRSGARNALILAVIYLGFGGVQNWRATQAVRALAQERGHSGAAEFTVKPSLGNLFLWRGMYILDERIRVDAIRVGAPGAKAMVYPGEFAQGVDLQSLKSRIPKGSPLYRDLERFDHFSDGYLAWHPQRPNTIGDARYAVMPNSIDPLWGIEVLEDAPDRHASFVSFREPDTDSFSTLFKMIRGQPVESLAD